MSTCSVFHLYVCTYCTVMRHTISPFVQLSGFVCRPGSEGSKVLKQVVCCWTCCRSMRGALGCLLLTGSCRGVATRTHKHESHKKRGEQVSRLMRLVYRRVLLLRQEVYHVAHKEQDWKHMGDFYTCG